MADAKDYLELWRERYSFPSYIGDNFRLSEDGTIVLDNEEEWSEAQRILLQGSAVGTSKNSYLDPKPLFNKLGEIYTNIINSSFASARTDSIKMNRNNMDYTNGSGLLVDQTPIYPFFCFLYNTPENVSSKEVYNDWYNENVVIDIITAISDNNINTNNIPNIITIDSKLLEDKHFPSFTKVEAVTLGDYLHYYTDWYTNYKNTFCELFNTSSDTPEDFWNKHWYQIISIKSDTLEQEIFYLPNEKFVEQFRLFKKKMLNKVRGLQLLMPQYHRRVEVEDLDENFWVISIILDAVVNALWGPYGLIDVVRQLILKVTQIEDFLGLDKLTGIELLHSGSDDMYFDMYSRFTLSGLELKLKTQNGERIIKNIFKGQSDTTDRKSTTDAYNSREELFAGIQFNEITPVENDLGSTGLYDSDLISSNSNVNLSNGKAGYLSLSTVIDAINNRITSDGNNKLSVTYDYSIGDGQDFFSCLDITPDGTLTPNDLKQISEDIIGDFSNLTQYELSRLVKYQNAKEFLISEFNADNKSEYWQNIFTKFGIETVEDIEKLFITKKGTMTFSAEELDANGDNILSDKEWVAYANGQLKEIQNFIKNLYENSSDITNNGKTYRDVSSLLQDGETTSINTLYNMYNILEAYFYRDNSINSNDNSNTDNIEEPYYIHIIEKKEISENYNDSFIACYQDKTNPTYGRLKIFAHATKYYNDYDSTSTSDSINLLGSFAFKIQEGEIPKPSELPVEVHISKNATYNPFDKIEEAIKALENSTYTKYYKNDDTTSIPRSSEDIQNAIRYNKNVLEALKQNFNVKTYKMNFSPYNKMGVSPLEDIYTYNEFTAKLIAQYIAAKSVTTLQYKSLVDEIDSNYTFYKYYFDTSEMDLNISENANLGISVYDCSKIITYLNSTNDALYFKNMKMLRKSIEANRVIIEEDSYSVIDKFTNLLNKYKQGNLKSKELLTDTYTVDNIKDILFTKKYEGSSTISKLVDICVPNQLLLELITSMATPVRIVKGTEITGSDAGYILNSIATHDYKLYGNILIFLYDEDYYELRAKIGDTKYYDKYDKGDKKVVAYKPQDGSEKVGLYVKAKDCFYGTEQPLIKYDLFYDINSNSVEENKDNTYALFVPRKDLINGEIIQLRLTEKGHNKKMLDFTVLDKDYGFNTFRDPANPQKGETYSKLFLSLHNCFANIPAQYNFRTTLFFDSTTPEDTGTTEGRPFKNVNDWFCNGIECQYFKPNMIKEGEDTKIGTNQVLRTDLQIKASMLAKKDPFNDNSFVFEEGPYDDPKTTEVYYTFSRRQAYCAAQRHNLLFYASPATLDGDMFIHSPLQFLQTPSTRSSETIQPTRWSPIPERGAVDVMSNKGDTCSIADVKNMLYKNSLTSEKRPLIVDTIWGSRYVDDYVKNKKMQYIVIEREPGARHNQYGPNCIGFSQSKGYLHANNGTQITSLNEKPHWFKGCKITWYQKDGTEIKYNEDNYFPPANAKYGVVDLTKFGNIDNEGDAVKFANNYMIRFYSSNLNHAQPPKNENEYDLKDRMAKEFSAEIVINEDKKTITRRPIFRMAYFFGEDESGKSSIKTGEINQESE